MKWRTKYLLQSLLLLLLLKKLLDMLKVHTNNDRKIVLTLDLKSLVVSHLLCDTIFSSITMFF